jgi:hypothetical protein
MICPLVLENSTGLQSGQLFELAMMAMKNEATMENTELEV